MSVFDTLCPIAVTSDEKLVAMARKVWPAIADEDAYPLKAKIIDPKDLVRNACFWDFKLLASAGVRPVSVVTTLHSFGAPVCFKPSAGEILVQIVPEIQRLEMQGISVTAYNCQPAFNGDPSLMVRTLYKDGQFSDTVHVGLTTLYEGELPKMLAQRPIISRGVEYPVQSQTLTAG